MSTVPPPSPASSAPQPAPAQPGGFSPAEAAAIRNASQRAQSMNPTRVVKAFFPEEVTIAGMRVQSFTLATFMLLERMGNGYVDDEVQSGARKLRLEEVAEALWVMVTPLAETRAAVIDGTWKEKVFDLAAHISPEEMAEAAGAIKRVFAGAFSTAETSSDPKAEAAGTTETTT